LAAYERALDWRELFDLAISTGMSSEQIQELGYRIAGTMGPADDVASALTIPIDDLGSKKRHEEAGRVLLEYCADVRQSVIAFVEAGAFAEARRVVRSVSLI
jgi:elongator complex protein 1